MKRSEIEEGIKSLFAKRNSLSSNPDFEFRFKDDGFSVEISTMYERLNLTFADLKAISDLCGTDKINLNEGSSYGGCESCDYGSSYGVVVSVSGVQIEIDV